MSKRIRVGLLFGDSATRDGRRLLLDTVPELDVVYEEEDGLRAIEAISDVSVDVILVDNRLRSISGSDFIRKYLRRNLTDGANLPAFVLTGPFSSVPMAMEAVRCGADDLVTEDESAEDLIDALVRAGTEDKLVDLDELRALFQADGLVNGSNTRWLLRLADLSAGEQQVLDALAEGNEFAEIHEATGLSVRQVHQSLNAIQGRFQVATRAQLVLCLYEAGLIPA